MKLFKQIDLGLQLLVVLVCAIRLFCYKEFLFQAFFIVLGYQSLSVISHIFLRRHYQQLKARQSYNIVLLVTALLSPSFFINDYTAGYIGVILLLSSPFLVIWYLYICYEEKKRLDYKEFVHLK
ncbi:MAG: hypothetical protein J7527_07930 [Chitinophagaceae bacterium]|nr:hypothetical protein [Chitinophagaceae bacterium]